MKKLVLQESEAQQRRRVISRHVVRPGLLPHLWTFSFTGTLSYPTRTTTIRALPSTPPLNHTSHSATSRPCPNMTSHMDNPLAVPAFASSTPLFHSRQAFASDALTSRRRNRNRAQPPRRRRPNRVTAVFIWSNEFDDDSSEDPEDHEPDTPETDHPFDENTWGDTWRRQRQGDFSSLDSDAVGPASSGAPTSAADDAAVSAVHHDPGNPLYSALRQQTIGPDDIDRLRSMSSESATDAFRRIVIGILGTIPTDTYEVVISTDRTGVSRLMQSSLSTGYALRNAEFRMVLNESMSTSGAREKTAAADGGDSPTVHDLFTSEPDYMKHVPRRGRVDAAGLSGVVRWWDMECEARQEMTGADYVAKLEAENELLRERLAATQLHDANNNKLMDFMRTLNPEKIAALQAHLNGEAVDAFKRVVNSVLGDLSSTKIQTTYSTSRDYLSQLTFWCLLVGYCIRNIEKRYEMTKVLEETGAFAEPSLRDVES